MNKEEVLQFLKQKKLHYFQRYHLSKLILFGSFAQDKAKENSDIDIVYELEQGQRLTTDDYFELLDELETRFKRKVDLVREKRMNPIIKMKAMKDFVYV